MQGDQLVIAVMRERGYPMDEFDAQASMIALDHPHVVEHYREAHAIAERARERDATTEELRRAFVRYRDLFEALVGPGPEEDRVHDRVGDRLPDDRVGDPVPDGRVGDPDGRVGDTDGRVGEQIRAGDNGARPGRHRAPGT